MNLQIDVRDRVEGLIMFIKQFQSLLTGNLVFIITAVDLLDLTTSVSHPFRDMSVHKGEVRHGLNL